jgi:hypothetical protein
MPELEDAMANPNPTLWMPPLLAAFHYLDRWIAEGLQPPSVRPFEVDAQSGNIVRDEFGITRGDVRLPHVEVPIP